MPEGMGAARIAGGSRGEPAPSVRPKTRPATPMRRLRRRGYGKPLNPHRAVIPILLAKASRRTASGSPGMSGYPRQAGRQAGRPSFIGPDGGKRFLAGTAKRGGYFSSVSLLTRFAFARATLRLRRSRVDWDCLRRRLRCREFLPVAKAIEGLPGEVIICADDDAGRPGNPGLTKAREAAIAIGARLAVPDFGPRRTANCTDFNDLARGRGPEAVRECIERAALSKDAEKKAADCVSAVPYDDNDDDERQLCTQKPCGSQNGGARRNCRQRRQRRRHSDSWVAGT